ncbi:MULTISPECIES: sulfate transporter CysZ [unclassified Endozoicomonas]|uniref:sulfate transporter CysZ n=1 Tax=unclassified Endozoicomonas TaxID=2644528 RepID=UPI002147A8C3|nr:MULTISPECIES: sulfate transporter CysZ [unclassified Endozoicomonas]
MPTPVPGSGLGYFFKGISYLPDPAIRWYVLIPLTVNILVFSFLIYLGLEQMSVLMESLLNWLPSWLSFLEFLLWPLLFLAMLGVVFFTFTIVGNFIASPFNGLLAEKVQNLHGKSDLPEYELKDWLTLLPRAIGREIRKLIYYLPKAVILLILSFIPVVNLITPVLWFMFNSWMMSIQYCDYAADNRGVSFNDMLDRLKQDRNYVWGFGATVTLVMLIPFINLLIMPAAVVGSTMLWEDRIE